MTAPTLPPQQERSRPTESSRDPRSGRDGLASVTRAIISRLRRIGELSRSPWFLGPIAAVWAAAIGLAIAVLPVLVVWMATPDSGLTSVESLHVAGLLWAVAHGAPVVVGAVTYSLLPWGLAVIPVVLLEP